MGSLNSNVRIFNLIFFHFDYQIGMAVKDETLHNLTSTNQSNTEDDSTKFDSSYWIGVGLSFTFATTG